MNHLKPDQTMFNHKEHKEHKETPGKRIYSSMCSLCSLWLIFCLGGCASRSPSPAAAASAQTLFSDKQTIEAACQRAAAENKKVFVAFDDSGPGENSGMGIAILGADPVASVLKARTIPVLLDVTEAPGITAKYNIKTLPSFLLLEPDGGELGRWTNTHDADDLASEINMALEGRSTVEQLRAKLKPSDVKGHLALARKLNAMGNYQEALGEYLWICNTGYPPGVQYSMSASNNGRYFRQAINDMVVMQKVFPAAKDALDEQYRLATDALLANTKTLDHRRYLTINRAIKDDKGLLDTFYKLPGSYSKKTLAPEVFDVLAKEKNYKEAVDIWSFDEALAALDDIKEAPVVMRGIVRAIFFITPLPTGKLFKQQQFRLLQKRAVYFAVYAGAGRTDDARVIAQKIIKWDRFSNAPLVLRKVAESVMGDKTDEFLRALNIPEITNAAAKSK